jgi:hypothetical protein
MRAFRSKSVVVLLAIAAIACDNTNLLTPLPQGSGGLPNAITIIAPPPSLPLGQSTQLSALVLDESGNVIPTPSVTWSSSNKTIATVTATGMIAAVALGTVTVTATSGDKSANANVTVTAQQVDTVPRGAMPGVAQLPTVFVDTKMPAVAGTIIKVAAGGDLQAALDAAQPGDAVELAPGATFTGNFVLRNKNTTSTNWIVIRPASGTGQLPAEGTRMSPSLAASLQLPRVATPNSDPVIQTEPGAHHYRIIGLELTAASSATMNYGLVFFGLSEKSLDLVPHHLVLDRTYTHGSSTLPLRRCVLFNSAFSAVIDSYLSDCHDIGVDAQAIGGWSGPGPFKIVNNYLEGSGENILFGGDDPNISGLVPSDIEIRRNHIFKPMSWRGGSWLIKNLIELKNAQRVLIESNVLENSWSNGQNGSAIVIMSANQSGTAPWSTASDVTIHWNRIKNVGNGFAMAASPGTTPTVHARRVTVFDNIIEGINTLNSADGGKGFSIAGDLADIAIVHNTILSPTSVFIWAGTGGDLIPRMVIRDNISGGGSLGIAGDGYIGLMAMNTYFPDAILTANVIIIADPGTPYPPGNFFPKQTSDVGFSDFASGDYSLGLLSPFKGKATDGGDPGANFAAVQSALQGVIQP